jgi:hypothetical protein
MNQILAVFFYSALQANLAKNPRQAKAETCPKRYRIFGTVDNIISTVKFAERLIEQTFSAVYNEMDFSPTQGNTAPYELN